MSNCRFVVFRLMYLAARYVSLLFLSVKICIRDPNLYIGGLSHRIDDSLGKSPAKLTLHHFCETREK